MRTVTLSFIEDEENVTTHEGLTDRELAEKAANNLVQILMSEKNPLDYLEWEVVNHGV